MYLPRNPLEYPAGFMPGFDPSHPAAAGTRFSAIAVTSGSFINLMNGAKGTVTSTPTPSIDGQMGPVIKFDGTDALTFPGMPTTNDLTCTIAAIFEPHTAPGAAAALCCSSSSAAGLGIVPASSLFQGFAGGVAVVSSGLSLSLNVPYFGAWSMWSSTLSYFVLRRLDTGSIMTASASGVTPTAPNGTHEIGLASGSTTANSFIAATMFASRPMTPAALLAWAADPWSFWYPQQADDWAFPQVGVASSFQPAWAAGANSVLSAGARAA